MNISANHRLALVKRGNMEITPARTDSATSTVEMSTHRLTLTALMQRATLLDGDIRSHAEKIQEKNLKLKETNEFLQVARNEHSELSAQDDDDATSAVPEDLRNFLDAEGIEYPSGGELKSVEWTALVENMQTYIDSHKSSSNTDLIDLQAIMNQHNENHKLITNFLSTSHGEKDSVIANMRL